VKKIEMKGMIFHNLTVLSEEGTDKRGELRWRCKCSCGNEVVVFGGNLRSGHTKSCGKCRIPLIIDEGEHLRCVVTNGKSFVFDRQDSEIVKSYYWTVEKNGYVRTNIKNKNIRLHRLIMDCRSDEVVDHINGDPADCRRKNMRVTTIRKNSYNKKISSRNSTGYKGVSFDRKKKLFGAYINPNGKTKRLGYFEKAEEAAIAYNTAASFYYGDFAKLNMIREGNK